MPQDSDLSGELKRLRRGRGLGRPDLSDVIGPELRRLCGVEESTATPMIRSAVIDLIRELIRGLPDDLRMVASAIYGLDRSRRWTKLEDRIQYLERELNLAERSVRRRMDMATAEMVRLAEDSQPEPPRADQGWRVIGLETLFRLDTPTPELYELRTIVATRELTDVPVRFTLPETIDDNADLTVDALFGCRVVDVERTAGNGGWKVRLTLPRSLPAGAKQEIWLRIVLPPGRPTWPHYAVVPLDPNDACTVRVRFAPDRPPAEVWLLDAVPYTDLCAVKPSGDPVRPSVLGDVSHRFGRLRVGHGYGFAWTPLE
jgi:hypothetical protein